MGWFSSLFNKKKEIETVYVGLPKLSAWFDENTEVLLGNIKEDMHAKLSEIKHNIDNAKSDCIKLEDASLRNDKIPERAIQTMKGNRDSYIRAVNLFLDQIKIPTAINIGNVTDFLSRFEENLDYFTKTSQKNYYVLQEFFQSESNAVAQHIKKIDIIARSLMDNDYKKTNAISERIAEVDDFLMMRKKASDLIEEEKTNYNSINAMKRDTEDKIEKLEKSRDFRDLQEIEKEKHKVESKIKSNELEVKSLFSPIEKSMKKYSKIALDGQEILEAYLDSPISALLKDENLLILALLGRMRDSVDQLDLNDKKKERTLAAMGNITRAKLENHAKQHYELVESIGKLKKRESINTASQKLNELNYKLVHLNNQLEKSRQQIEKLGKQIEKSDLSKIISEIEKDVLSLLEIRLKIRWKNEADKESA